MTEVPWDVAVEVVLLRLVPGTGLAYRAVRVPVATGQDLDAAALAASGLQDDTAVLHSTSWRQETGTVVLTYAALPDPDETSPAVPLTAPSVVAGGTSLRPSPEVLHLHHVVAHAVRHLSDLAVRDPVVRAAADRRPELWQAVLATAVGIPTGTHDVAHALAEEG